MKGVLLSVGVLVACCAIGQVAIGVQRIDPPSDDRRYSVDSIRILGPYQVAARDLRKQVEPRRKLKRISTGADDLVVPDTERAAGCPDGDCLRRLHGEGSFLRTPPLVTGPVEIVDIAGNDPQIAASSTHLVVTAYNQIAWYTKDGNLVTKDEDGDSIVNPISMRDLVRPLWNPANPDNINTTLNLPADLPCDPADPYQAGSFCLDDYYDTRVIFDAYRHRFWIGALARNSRARGGDTKYKVSARRTKVVLAVSLTEDPRDGFYIYGWDADIGDGACNYASPQAAESEPLQCPGSEFRPTDGGDYPNLGISPLFFIQTNGVANGNNNPTQFDDDPNNDTGSRYSLINVFVADALANATDCPVSCGWAYWKMKDPQNGSIVTTMVQPAVQRGHMSFNVAAMAGIRCTLVGCDDDTLLIYTISPVEGLYAPPLHELSWSSADWNPQVTIGAPAQPWQRVNNAPQRPAGNVTKPARMNLANLGNSVLKASSIGNQMFLTLQDCVKWTDTQSECSTSIRIMRLEPAQAFLFNTTVVSVDRTFGLRNDLDDGSDDIVYYGNAAVEMNGNGDAVAVYSRSGETVFPEVRYTALLHGEPDVRPSALLHAGSFPVGTSSPTDAGGNPTERLGNLDTGGIALDPFDGTAIWMAHAYGIAVNASQKEGTFRLAIGKVFGRPHPDLVIDDLDATPPVTKSGASLTLDVVVRNQGDGSSPGPRVQVYLSQDRSLSVGSDVKIADFLLGSVGPGNVTGASIMATIPQNAPPGTNYAIAVIDPLNVIAEYGETNNDAARGLHALRARIK